MERELGSEEVILPIRGFEGYFVSSSGRVFKELKVGGGSSKYPQARLRKSGKTHIRFVHHLVLEEFVGPRPVGQEARHLNDNPTDNRLSNLAWGTHRQNVEDRRENSGPPIINTPDQFWDSVSESGSCWLWLGKTDQSGRGKVTTDTFPTKGAHRIAWLLVLGHEPKGHLWNMCGRPRCVRPDHQELRSGCSREVVQDIRNSYGTKGVTYKSLARKHGLSISTVSNIVKGNTYLNF